MLRIRWLSLVVLCLALSPLTAQDAPLTLTYIGEQTIATGTLFRDTEVGGLSAITYDAKRSRYYAISDDRGEHGPIRFYTLALDLDESGFHGVTIESVTPIQAPDGSPLAAGDAEGLAYIPQTDTLVWSSEHDENNHPSLREMTLAGAFVREFTLPDAYTPGSGRGAVDNASLESLALSFDGQQIITATEAALVQDGAPATREQGSLSRLLMFDRDTGEAAAEYVYETGPIPHDATLPPFSQDNGLVDLVALDETTLLTLERAFMVGVGNTITISRVSLEGATPVTGWDTLAQKPYTPVTKTPLLKLEEDHRDIDPDNVEGMTLGPVIDGKRTLILVSDNNFNPRFQPLTQFLVFTLDIP